MVTITLLKEPAFGLKGGRVFAPENRNVLAFAARHARARKACAERPVSGDRISHRHETVKKIVLFATLTF